MDKQKQIEEMAKVVQRDMCGDIPCEECNYHGKMKILPRYCGTYLIVEKLYNAGYRKIPKGSVVLTNKRLELGEYKVEVQVMTMTRQVYDAILAQVRKETAEKFAERLLNKDNIFEEKDNSYLFYKEEIYEIAKEITEVKK